MELVKVMDELGERLDTIDGLRVTEWPPGQAQPPFAIVGFPETIEFDKTYGRGSDVYRDLPILVGVPRPTERQARDQLAPYCDGSGPKSIKAVLESGAYVSFDEVVVTRIEIDAAKINGVDYLVAACLCDIAGEGDPV